MTDRNDVAKVADWVQSKGIEVGIHVSVKYNDQYGSVQIIPKEYMNKSDYRRYVNVMRDADWINYDGDRNRNYAFPEDIPEGEDD